MDDSWDARPARGEATGRALALLAVLVLTLAVVMAVRTGAARLSHEPGPRTTGISAEARA